MLIWYLKQIKDFNLKLSISGSFFSGKEYLNVFTIILFSFALGGCVDDVSIMEQIIKDTNMCIYFSIPHLQSSI